MEVERAVPEPPLRVVYKVGFNGIGQSIFIVMTKRAGGMTQQGASFICVIRFRGFVPGVDSIW